jgi:uncharacterized protein (TIGR03435 family)
MHRLFFGLFALTALSGAVVCAQDIAGTRQSALPPPNTNLDLRKGEGQPNEKQRKPMLQKMLADRFKPASHHEKREVSVYAITAAETGPKLTKSEGNPSGLPNPGFSRLGAMNATNANMSDLAGVFQAAVLDRPAVDQTDIRRRFDFQLKWMLGERRFSGMGIKAPPSGDSEDAAPDLFAAFQEQLGLKPTATKAPVGALVIDCPEKPSEN